MKNYTDITVLLDRSGSMRSIKDATESGFKEFITGHKEVPSTRLTVVQFDSGNDQEVVINDQPINNIEGITLEPRGMTPLCDALCKAIDSAGRRLAKLPESERPSRVLFVIITDGLENASHTFNRKDVRERIERQTSGYNWQFTYLGANQDVFKEADAMGIAREFAMAYAADNQHTGSTFRSLTANTVGYTKSGNANSLGYTISQRKEAMDTDPKDSANTQ